MGVFKTKMTFLLEHITNTEILFFSETLASHGTQGTTSAAFH